MGLGPERIAASVQLGALSTTTEYMLWSNATGESYELESATFNQLDAITASTNGFYTIGVMSVTTAGTHSTEIAVTHFGTASATAYAGDHTAYVPEDLTLDTTGLGVDDGEGLTVLATKSGTASNLSADARVDVILVRGMTAAH